MSSQDEFNCKKIRKDIFVAAVSGGAAHLASCYSCVEILYVLYSKGILKYNVNDWSDINRDKFVLSKGHGALALYSVLKNVGIISDTDFNSYLKQGSHVGGEPNVGDLPGIEASTGSLGHGLPIAIGMAMAQKLNNQASKTYVLLGDGECQEGSIWEAAMSATAFNLDNLITILDYNELQKTSRVDEKIKLINWKEKWSSFGWNVIEVDGHNIEELADAMFNISLNGKPTIVIAHTVKGKGVSIMEGNPIWHYKMPNRKEKRIFLEELGMDQSELEI